MRWPPNKAWTSAEKIKGFRHFEVKTYGGKGEERWVELFAAMDQKVIFKVNWSEMKTYSKWRSGWLQLPNEADS